MWTKIVFDKNILCLPQRFWYFFAIHLHFQALYSFYMPTIVSFVCFCFSYWNLGETSEPKLDTLKKRMLWKSNLWEIIYCSEDISVFVFFIFQWCHRRAISGSLKKFSQQFIKNHFINMKGILITRTAYFHYKKTFCPVESFKGCSGTIIANNWPLFLRVYLWHPAYLGSS